MIAASSKNGNELWDKEVMIEDFSAVFDPSSILVSKKGNYFKIKRESSAVNFDSGEESVDYASLSKEEMKTCILYSLKYALR